MKSSDGGATWTNTGLQEGELHSFGYDPRNVSVLYAANRSRIFKSTNGGQNWYPIITGLPADWLPLQFIVDPANANTLYVLGSGANSVQTIYHSTNGGTSWTLIFSAPYATMPEKAPISIAVDPRHLTLYIGTYRGLFKSTDGGQTVQSAGLPEPSGLSITIDPSDSSTIYVSTVGLCCEGTPFRPLGGMAKTTDGGKTWVRLNNSLRERPVAAIGVDPNNSANVFAMVAPFESVVVYAVRMSQNGFPVTYSLPVATGGGNALASDAAGNLYAVGIGGLPATPNGLQSTRDRGFALKVNSAARIVSYATYLNMAPTDVALDRANTVILTGSKSGAADALVKNAFQETSQGGDAVFLCRLDPQRSGPDSLLYGSYFGSNTFNAVPSVDVDANGMVYVFGQTSSTDFPLTAGSFSTRGNSFLSK